MLAAIFICAFIFGSLSFVLEKHVIILATSLGGSYLTLRSASIYFGGWPPETQIADFIKNEAWDAIPNDFWLYMAGVVVMTVVGAVVQYKYNEDDDEKGSKRTKAGQYYEA